MIEKKKGPRMAALPGEKGRPTNGQKPPSNLASYEAPVQAPRPRCHWLHFAQAAWMIPGKADAHLHAGLACKGGIGDLENAYFVAGFDQCVGQVLQLIA